jgi:hypothetical protein
MEKWDVSKLAEIKVRHLPSTPLKYSSPHGNMKYPYIFGKSDKVRNYYRISCSVRGKEGDFPVKTKLYYSKGKYGGDLRPCCILTSLDHVLMYIIWHEFVHYLSCTKQIDIHWDDERGTRQMAYDLIKRYEEGK